MGFGFDLLAAQRRLIERLQLPPTTTELSLLFSADCLPRCTVTWLLSPEEIDQISTWYDVGNLQLTPEGTTTYNLEPRPSEELQPEQPLQCHPAWLPSVSLDATPNPLGDEGEDAL